MIQAQMFQIHESIVDELEPEDKSELVKGRSGMEDSLRNSGGALQQIMKICARMPDGFRAS